MSPLAYILTLPVRGYRLLLSPWVGHYCRYQPTCSAYALEALQTHGGIKGSYLSAHRICRCNPFGGDGYDPVPPAKKPAGPASSCLENSGGGCKPGAAPPSSDKQ